MHGAGDVRVETVPGIDDRSDLLPSLLTLSDVYLTGWHAAQMGHVEPGKTSMARKACAGLSSYAGRRQTTVAVLEERIAGFEAQAALAASTDFPPGG
jgi:hypothetical protein